jgi:hypothetical protein
LELVDAIIQKSFYGHLPLPQYDFLVVQAMLETLPAVEGQPPEVLATFAENLMGVIRKNSLQTFSTQCNIVTSRSPA